MLKIRNIILLLITTLLLSGCKFALLDPKGTIAADEKFVLVFATLLMLVIVIPVIVMSFIIVYKYRASNKSAKYAPEWAHSNLLEAICWTVPCIIIAILAAITWISTHKLDPYRPLATAKKPIIIQAVALDWKWLFIYPQQKIATVNYLQIPVNRPVRFLITADAPMNSLEIPRLAGQVYAMTGMRTQLNIMATSMGSYRGLSTNFSGNGFSNMHFTVRVSNEEQYKSWVVNVQKTALPLNMQTYNKLAKPSEINPVAYYNAPVKDLFNTILMKYMGPGMTHMLDNGEPSMPSMTDNRGK